MGASGNRGRYTSITVEPNNHAQTEENTYSTFKANRTSSHKFFDSDKEYVDFMESHTNLDELISKMSSKEIRHFQAYTVGALMFGRNHTEIEQTMDKYIDKSTIDKDLIVHRRADGYLLHDNPSIPSMTEIQRVIDSGQLLYASRFMSTSAAGKGLTIGKPGTDIDYKIKIPKGTGKAMFIGNRVINNEWGTLQREVVISRHAILKPVSVTKAKEGMGSKYTVTLQVVGVQKH